MDISKINPKALEFTEEELDALTQILAKAEEIKKDSTLYRLVQKHADKKITEFKSVEDLKKHSKNLADESTPVAKPVKKPRAKVETDEEEEEEEEAADE